MLKSNHTNEISKQEIVKVNPGCVLSNEPLDFQQTVSPDTPLLKNTTFRDVVDTFRITEKELVTLLYNEALENHITSPSLYTSDRIYYYGNLIDVLGYDLS